MKYKIGDYVEIDYFHYKGKVGKVSGIEDGWLFHVIIGCECLLLLSAEISPILDIKEEDVL